jgi:hypothetical protein
MRELQKVKREIDDYFRSISPSPYLSPNRTETVQARFEDALSKYLRICEAQLSRELAAIKQDQQKELAAIERVARKEVERELSRLRRDYGE